MIGVIVGVPLVAVMVIAYSSYIAPPESNRSAKEDAAMLEANKENFEATMRVYRKPCDTITNIHYHRAYEGDSKKPEWSTTCSNGITYRMWQTDCYDKPIHGQSGCLWQFR